MLKCIKNHENRILYFSVDVWINMLLFSFIFHKIDVISNLIA